MSGAAVGFRSSSKGVKLDMTMAMPLRAKQKPKASVEFYLSASVEI